MAFPSRISRGQALRYRQHLGEDQAPIRALGQLVEDVETEIVLEVDELRLTETHGGVITLALVPTGGIGRDEDVTR